MTSNGPSNFNKSPGRATKMMENESARTMNSNVMVFHGAASNKHPPVAIKSVEEVRRNSLNMEKMIKKNVMTSSSKNPLKRGLAVVEYFKNKNKQSGQVQEEEHDRNKKKQVVDRPMPVSAAQISIVPSSSKHNIPTNRPGSLLLQQRNKSPSIKTSSNPNKKIPVNSADMTVGLTSPPHPSRQILSTPSIAAALCSPSHSLQSPPLREKVITMPSPRKAKEVPEPCSEDQISMTDINRQSRKQVVSPFESIHSKQHEKSPKPGNTLGLPPRATTTPPRLGAKLPSAVTTTPLSLGAKSPSAASSSTSSVKSTPAVTATKVSTPSTTSRSNTSSPPPLPLMTNNISSKSMCFSIETIATSLDVTPDGECILVGFANGSVRLYEMDSKVSSDRYGYLLGHLDEATGTTPNGSNSTSHHNASDGMSTNAMTLRLKITSDGRYVFVGTRTGLRAIMSIHLQHYRHGKEDTNTQGEDDEEDDDGQDIKKHYHMDAKLRGFADVTKSSVYYQGRNRNAYYLLFGLGVGTLRMWRFIETHRGPVWEHLYGVSAGGNTLSWASFVYNHNKKMIEGIMSICYDKNLRVWQVKEEENHDEKEKKEATKRLIIKGHKDVPHCKEIVDVQGNFAYGITMGGDLYRIQLSTSASCTATTLGKRQQFELEVLVDTTTTSNSTTTIASMNSSSVNGGSNSGRRSGRSNAATGGKSLIENCYATSDGRSVIAVSTDGVFYSYNTTEKHSDEMSDILWMKIIGRLGGCSWSGSNGSKSPPVYLYEPIDTMTTTSKHGQAMMAVVSNAAHGAGNGFFTVDSIQAYAQRWDQKRENVEKNQTDFDHLLVANWPDPVKSQRYREYQRLKIQGVLNECWNCSARDVLHWEKNTSTTSSMKSTSSSSSSSTKHKGKNITTTTTSSRSSSNDGGSSSKQKVIAPCEVGVMKSSSISGTSPSPISMTNTTKSLKPTPSPSPSPSNHQRKNNNSRQEQIQKHKRPQSQANSNTNTNTNTNTTTLSASPPLTMIKMSSKHKKQRIIQDDEDEDEDEDNDNDNDDVDTETDTDADKENDTLLLLQVRIKQLEQEVDRYKERYDRIETEWQRRLNAERQLRRLWKKREAQYQEQIHSSQIQMNQLQKKLDQETEKKFALEKIEKLQLDQQNSVKSRYEKLCILTQEKIVEIEKQQKNMEQTSQILLKEVDRQVQSLKNWSGNEKNECIICKEEEAVMAIIPCGHLCFCEQDALKYQRQMQQKQFAKCPICEIELISFLRIY